MKTKTLYWSRIPGKFVDAETGKELHENYDSWIEVGQTFIEARPRIMVKFFQATDNFSFEGTTEEWNKGLQRVIASAQTIIFQENFQIHTKLTMSRDVYEKLFSYAFRWNSDKTLNENDLAGKTPVAMLQSKLIFLDPLLKEDEIVLVLDAKQILTPRKVGTSETEKLMLSNGMAVQAPKIPDVDVELLPEVRRLAEVKIKVLDLHVA